MVSIKTSPFESKQPPQYELEKDYFCGAGQAAPAAHQRLDRRGSVVKLQLDTGRTDLQKCATFCLCFCLFQ